MTVQFQTDAARMQAKFDKALAMLRANLAKVYGYDQPVLKEGSEYNGIWLECGPTEGLVYGQVDPKVAFDNHRIFFRLQRDDGYLPCWIWLDKSGASQIQMVVPIAATALETFQLYGDREFLAEAYRACSRWDAWLARYRDTRRRGLCEAFCEYDTGHDNSPRWKGLPHACPDDDARVCPAAGRLPYLAPDLSATVYGGRVALAAMADLLNRPAESLQWRQKAEQTRAALLKHCYDPRDECFYDVDADGQFVRIRGDALTRVLSEHVVDQPLFERIYARQIHNPRAFWTPYPLPSIAADDPAFNRSLPHNSWGGASQALTALRAPRWFDHYGKAADLAAMMSQWLKALLADSGFKQQMNPWTGRFTTFGDGYSPALLTMIDFTARLHGVTRQAGQLHWSCLLPETATRCRHAVPTPGGIAELVQEKSARAPSAGAATMGVATLTLCGRTVAHVTSPCRIVTDADGRLLAAVAISSLPQRVTIQSPGRPKQELDLLPNSVIAL